MNVIVIKSIPPPPLFPFVLLIFIFSLTFANAIIDDRVNLLLINQDYQHYIVRARVQVGEGEIFCTC